MRSKLSLIALFSFLYCSASGQVLSPNEITDPVLRGLQQKYGPQLEEISAAIRAHRFPFRFYLSRKLGLTESQQQASDQRAIQFDNYHGQVVLKFTGNYFAAYSADLMTDSERARATYENVILPILLEAVPKFAGAATPQAFALEISHHVRKKVLGVTNEQTENVVLVLQKDAADRLIAAKNDAARHSAALEGEAFLNAQPVMLWPEDEKLLVARRDSAATATAAAGYSASAPVANPPLAPKPTVSAAIIEGPSPKLSPRNLPPPTMPAPAPAPVPEKAAPAQDSAQAATPDSLKDRDTAYHAQVEKMLKELEPQAHFVAYAPPAFIAFRNGAYLQISVTTTLPDEPGSSLYRLAALAFDRHVAHLIRPVIAYFKDSGDFAGIDFSTSIRTSGASDAGGAEAVEYIFSLRDLKSYENFDITGQDLIRNGFILVNGERISLDLQEAEGKK